MKAKSLLKQNQRKTSEEEEGVLKTYFSPREVESHHLFHQTKKVVENGEVKEVPISIGVVDFESDGRDLLLGIGDLEGHYFPVPFPRGSSQQDVETLLDAILGSQKAKQTLVKKAKEKMPFLDEKELWENISSINLDFVFAYNIAYDFSLLLTMCEEVTTPNEANMLFHDRDRIYRCGHYTVEKMKLFYHITFNSQIFRQLLAYDLMQYYQSSLEKSFQSVSQIFSDIPLSTRELEEWKEEKKKRDQIVSVFSQETVNYNRLDIKVTAWLAKHLEEYYSKAFENVGLSNVKIDYTMPSTALDLISPTLNHVTYRPVKTTEEMAKIYMALAYYQGGFFQTLKIGRFSNVYKYDVNSMYPAMMSLLPNLEFEGFVERPTDTFDLVCGIIENKRTDGVGVIGRTRAITPMKEQWTCSWNFELNPSLLRDYLSHFGIPMKVITGAVAKTVDLVLHYRPLNSYPFREVINKIYTTRNQMKKENNPLEKALKIMMNSSYGKFGEMKFRKSVRERLEYAGLITAMGRTLIQNQVDPQKVITYMTDSIVTLEPLSETGDKLGQFKDETEKGTFVSVTPGVYAFLGEQPVIHTRGFLQVVGKQHLPNVKFFLDFLKAIEDIDYIYEAPLITTEKALMVKSNYTYELLLKKMEEKGVKRDVLGLLERDEINILPFNFKLLYSRRKEKDDNVWFEGSSFNNFIHYAVSRVYILRKRTAKLRDKITPDTIFYADVYTKKKKKGRSFELTCENLREFYTLNVSQSEKSFYSILCGRDYSPIDVSEGVKTHFMFTPPQDKFINHYYRAVFSRVHVTTRPISNVVTMKNPLRLENDLFTVGK